MCWQWQIWAAHAEMNSKQPGEPPNIHVYAWSNYYDSDALGNSGYGSAVAFSGSREMVFWHFLCEVSRAVVARGAAYWSQWWVCSVFQVMPLTDATLAWSDWSGQIIRPVILGTGCLDWIHKCVIRREKQPGELKAGAASCFGAKECRCETWPYNSV